MISLPYLGLGSVSRLGPGGAKLDGNRVVLQFQEVCTIMNLLNIPNMWYITSNDFELECVSN